MKSSVAATPKREDNNINLCELSPRKDGGEDYMDYIGNKLPT